ncbi:hypothetical protein C8039_07580 [Halogeometricum sp. wsp3]|nr:hypothetical protein C8039_07580 [Halogeometricum sp. wsp3]
MTFNGDRVEWADAFDDKHGACSGSCSDEQISSSEIPPRATPDGEHPARRPIVVERQRGTIADDGVIDGTEGTTTLSAGSYHVDGST